MPQAAEAPTITVRLPSGKLWDIPRENLVKAKAAGAVEVQAPQQQEKKPDEGIKIGPIARETALGVGTGLGIPETQHPITDIAKSLIPNFKDPKVLANLASGGMTRILTEGLPLLKSEFGLAKEAAAPVVRDPLLRHPERVTQDDLNRMAHGISALLTQVALMKSGESAAKAPKSFSKGAAQEIIGLGKSKVGEMAAEREQTAAEKVQAIKEKYAKTLEETAQGRKSASAAQSASETKKSALVTKQGPVYKRMNQVADSIQSRVQALDKQVHAREDAKWEAFKKPLEGVKQDASPVAEKIEDVQRRILSTDTVPIFKKIMEEIEAEDPLAQASVFRKSSGVDVKDLLRNPAMGEAAKQRILRSLEEAGETPGSGYTPRANVTVDYLRRLSTKIGQKMYSSSVPRDVYRALKEVQGTVEQQIEAAVKEAMGDAGIKTYRKLKEDWRQYQETFWDKDSPVAKLKGAKDPNDKLNPIVGDEGQRAIKLLSRYRDIGSGGSIGMMGRLRALNKALRSMSAKGAKMPAEADRPSLDVERKSSNPEDIRRELVRKRISEYSNPTRWELRFPPLRAESLLIKKILESSGIQDWLTKGPL